MRENPHSPVFGVYGFTEILHPDWLNHLRDAQERKADGYPAQSAFQQVHGFFNVSDSEVAGERWVFLRNLFVHRVSYITVGKVPGGSAAQLGDIEGFGKIH